MFWFAVVPLQLTALYFSYTRSIWIGTSLAIFVVLWLTLRGVWRTLIVGGLATAMLLAAAMNVDKLTDLQREGKRHRSRRLGHDARIVRLRFLADVLGQADLGLRFRPFL